MLVTSAVFVTAELYILKLHHNSDKNILENLGAIISVRKNLKGCVELNLNYYATSSLVANNKSRQIA